MTRASVASCAALMLAGLLATSVPALAQNSRSAQLAADLARELEARKLDSMAASLGGDEWVGVLHLSGSELLVVKGTYAGPVPMADLVGRKAYREAYININSASDPATKLLVSDFGANGLRPRRENGAPADRADVGGKSYAFDGDWGRARLSEAEYSEAFRTADDQYVRMLQALLVETRKGS
jgi:hypothetical protein